jgi:hypothetical protein
VLLRKELPNVLSSFLFVSSMLEYEKPYLHSDDGGSNLFRNFDDHLPVHNLSYPRKFDSRNDPLFLPSCTNLQVMIFIFWSHDSLHFRIRMATQV